jgi:hypothetical protein
MIRPHERKVGSQYVITSPDVPGLYVAHEDIGVALGDVAEVVAAMDRVRLRIDQQALHDHKAMSVTSVRDRKSPTTGST